MRLGGNIELVGFRQIDGGSLTILKKLIGNHVRQMSSTYPHFEGLTLKMKSGGDNNPFEIHAVALKNGIPVQAEHTDYNLFFTIDRVLHKVHNELQK